MDKKLSESLQEEIIGFFDIHPPDQFSVSLRNVLITYIKQNLDRGFPANFSDTVSAIGDLLLLLEKAAGEFSQNNDQIVQL